MNSTSVLKVINKIAATAGKIDKQALVVTGMKDALFQSVCEYAYNPFKTYGVRQIPERTLNGVNEFDDEVFAMLDNMVARRLTGNAARVALQETLDQLNEASADLLTRIVRGDLRAGFSESTINKACKGLIPEFPYMRCSLPKDAKLETWPWAEGAISQEKADGMFANADHELDGSVSIRSRQGSEFPMDKFAAVAADISERMTPGHQQHGEFVVIKGGVICARAIGNGILNGVLAGGDFEADEKPLYLVWDQIPLGAVVPKGKCDVKYKIRLGMIAKQLKANAGNGSVGLIPTRIVKSLKEAYAHAVELMKKGKEGTVVKNPDMLWKDGTSKDQVKLKLEFEIDLKITGIVPGKAGTKTEGRAGSLHCESSDGKVVSDVTVKNEKMRDEVDANPDDWIGRIIVVVANDITLPSESNELHSLFLPRMVEAAYRTDKTVADDIDRIFAAKELAILGESLLKEAA